MILYFVKGRKFIQLTNRKSMVDGWIFEICLSCLNGLNADLFLFLLNIYLHIECFSLNRGVSVYN